MEGFFVPVTTKAERFSEKLFWRAELKTLAALLGLVLIFEGLPYATFPEAMQNWLKQLLDARPVGLRIMGVVAVLAGLLLCYLARRTPLFG